MRLGGRVTLEPILVPTLLLTHLTKPTEFLESLGLHLISQILGCTLLGFRHFELDTLLLRSR